MTTGYGRDEAMTAGAVLWTAEDTRGCLHWPTVDSDKYSRGVVGIRTGSDAYPGAAVLGVQAAWRTGVGMVRYVGPARAVDLVLRCRPETVIGDGRVQAWVVGSGTDAARRLPAETAALRGILAGDVPVVVDAGALDVAVSAAAPVSGAGVAAPWVVTPHARENDRLRRMLGLAPAATRDDAARTTASALGAAVLLKGSVTVVATPSGWTAHVDAATPWLATAGTGDVLAGVLGALVAGDRAHRETSSVGGARGDTGCSIPAGRTVDVERLGRLAAAAAWLHGRAGVAASLQRGGGPITALDVADALPGVVAEVLAR